MPKIKEPEKSSGNRTTTTIFNDGIERRNAKHYGHAHKRKLTQQIHSQTKSTYIIMGRTVSRVASIVRGIIVFFYRSHETSVPVSTTTLASAVATGPTPTTGRFDPSAI
jgi:hypothetical protein